MPAGSRRDEENRTMTETRVPYIVERRPDASRDVAQRDPFPFRADPNRLVVVADFPGCKPVRIQREDIELFDGRFEYWDARTEVAMSPNRPPPTTSNPAQRLARLTERIALARGLTHRHDRRCRPSVARRVWCQGADHAGGPKQCSCIRGATGPRAPAMEVGNKLPDVVLEVDHTTDVYQRKIEFYESWGFPELWVEVPDHTSPSRPKDKQPGLRIHVLGPHGRFEERVASATFPAWQAAEIHRALNEDEMSVETMAVLRRIGRALGEREGTSQDDALLLREEREQSRTEGMRAMLYDLAVARLGARASNGLTPLMADIDDPDVLLQAESDSWRAQLPASWLRCFAGIDVPLTAERM